MKCPRCGAEMTLDTHRKIPLNMCYECGYIEGRSVEDSPAVKDVAAKTNFAHLKGLNLGETAAFLSEGLKAKGVEVPQQTILEWLTETVL